MVERPVVVLKACLLRARILIVMVKDRTPPSGKHPLIVISHGRGGTLLGHHDTAETLADAGFIVAAINHAGDTAQDLSHSGDLSIFVARGSGDGDLHRRAGLRSRSIPQVLR